MPRLSQRQLRQMAMITAAALAIYAGLRWIPTGTNLSHMDFRVDASNPIEFCDPLNPQFIPVVAVASPVTLTIDAPPAHAGEEVRATVVLRTASGKRIAPEDLLVVHTRRLHLLIVDPALEDYQHVHPEPGAPGEWTFAFTPHADGTYRVFADFTPSVTGRGLYAYADLPVASRRSAVSSPLPVQAGRSEFALAADEPTDTPATEGGRAPGADPLGGAVERDGYRFTLQPAVMPVRAGRVADLKFTVLRPDGAAVPLEPVMDAFAHLVAIDETRSGFAHLHPAELDLTRPPDAIHPELNFKITIPSAGRYVIWAQVNLGGREVFVPFWFDVASAG